MKARYFVMAFFAMLFTFNFSSCSHNDDEDDVIENNGNSKESLLIGKWIPYTYNDRDYSFLEDVGWLQMNKNHTYEMYSYDKELMYSGKWTFFDSSIELIKDTYFLYDEYDSNLLPYIKDEQIQCLKLLIERAGNNYWKKFPKLSKEEFEKTLVGGSYYYVIEDIHSNYMRIMEVAMITAQKETASVNCKIEWRRE